MASKIHTKKRCHSTGPGTKEVPGEEMAPRNTSAAGNPPLSENHRTSVYPGLLSLVNKLVVHMSKTSKIIYTCTIVSCTHVEDVKDYLKYMYRS